MKTFIYSILMFAFFSCQQNTKVKNETLTQDSKTIDSARHQKKLSFIDSSKIVIDTTSNFIWMKDDFSYIKGRFLNDWNETFEWEKEMNANKYAGYNDWRVPTIKEYRTINKNNADREKYNKQFNYIDSISIWGEGPYAFWSRTTPNKNTASYISFLDGFATSGSRSKHYSNPYSDWKGVELGMSVRLVRENK